MTFLNQTSVEIYIKRGGVLLDDVKSLLLEMLLKYNVVNFSCLLLFHCCTSLTVQKQIPLLKSVLLMR